MLKYIDIHCHFKNFDAISNTFEKARTAGVVAGVCNASSEEDWEKLVSISKNAENIFCALGIHPWFINNLSKNWDNKLIKILSENPKIMVGEIGLDKYKADLSEQEQIFERQLEIATDLKRPAFIHCVGAWDKLLNILKEHKNKLPPKIIFHSYGGSSEIMRTLLNKYNVYFSYSPVILEAGHVKAKQALETMPTNRILIESDSDNIESIINVADKISEIRNTDKGTLINQIYENSIRVLNDE